MSIAYEIAELINHVFFNKKKLINKVDFCMYIFPTSNELDLRLINISQYS